MTVTKGEIAGDMGCVTSNWKDTIQNVNRGYFWKSREMTGNYILFSYFFLFFKVSL